MKNVFNYFGSCNREIPHTVEVKKINGELFKIRRAVVKYDVVVFAQLCKYIKAYQNDNALLYGHYIVVVGNQLYSWDASGENFIRGDVTSDCGYLGVRINPRRLPDKVKAELVRRFGHLVD